MARRRRRSEEKPAVVKVVLPAAPDRFLTDPGAIEVVQGDPPPLLHPSRRVDPVEESGYRFYAWHNLERWLGLMRRKGREVPAYATAEGWVAKRDLERSWFIPDDDLYEISADFARQRLRDMGLDYDLDAPVVREIPPGTA